MKKIFKILRNLIIFVYMLLIISIIISILFYNDHGITELGNYTIMTVNDENLQSKFSPGDLVIANKNDESSIKVGDEVLFYKANYEKGLIQYSKISNIDSINDNEYEYTSEDRYSFQSTELIGKTDTSIVVPKAGMVLDVLQSKQGFFCLVVIPLVITFIYTLSLAIFEVKGKKGNKKIDSDIEQKENIVNDKKEEKIENDLENKLEELCDISEDKEIYTNDEEISDEIKVENYEDIDSVIEEDTDNKIEEYAYNDNYEEENSVESEENYQEPVQTNLKSISEEERKALIKEKLNSMTDEEKKALVQAKLNSMTPEERKAFIEERKRKMNLK